MALTKALESERGQQTGNSRFAGSWSKGQFSRLLLSLPSISNGYPAVQWQHPYRDFADTIARTRFFFFYSCRPKRMMELRRKGENLEKYHDREIKRNGRFAFPVPSITRPGRKADGCAERGTGARRGQTR